MKKSRKILLFVLLLILLAGLSYWLYTFFLVPCCAPDLENLDSTETVVDEKPYIECETAGQLHSFYEEEGFITNDCGDYGLVEILEWYDESSGHALDWKENEVEFWY